MSEDYEPTIVHENVEDSASWKHELGPEAWSRAVAAHVAVEVLDNRVASGLEDSVNRLDTSEEAVIRLAHWIWSGRDIGGDNELMMQEGHS